MKFVKSYNKHINWVTSAKFSPSNEYFVSGSDDSTVKVWHTETG